MRLTHGGDITGYVEEFGTRPLDFSANVSPLGLPQQVREAVIAALDQADEYPDPLNRRLSQAIADHEGLTAGQVLCGNGTADLIYRIPTALQPARVLMPAPTFSEYADALEGTGCQVLYHPLDPARGFALDQGFLDCIQAGIQLVFICQPNNPTGNLVSRSFMEQVLAACEQAGARLVVDECFLGFTEEEGLVDLVPGHPSLLVLKAFTKLYAMPGIRLGYLLCSDGDLIQALRAAGQPWAVSNLAQAAGIAALACTEYVEQTQHTVALERAFLIQELAKLGIHAQGTANFLFFQLDDGGALTGQLRDQGILIRDCSNFQGLGPGSYRIAVKAHQDNLTLLAALVQVLGQGEGE